MADTAFYSPELTLEQKVAVLEEVDVEARLRMVLAWARETLADETVLDDINKELGDGDEDVVADYHRKLDESGAPEAVREAVERELAELERTSGQSPEQGWILTWLDTVLEVPWAHRADEHFE